MQSSGNYPLNEIVHVNKFYVGGEKKDAAGRCKSKKRLVVVALDILEAGGVGRAYDQVIDDASAKSL